MSLIQGCSFRIGSPFPGAVRGEASAEPRSRYDASIRRRFIIAGFSKESSLADNTLFLTVRKFPSPRRWYSRSWKIPGNTEIGKAVAGPQLAVTEFAALLYYETRQRFRITVAWRKTMGTRVRY